MTMMVKSLRHRRRKQSVSGGALLVEAAKRRGFSLPRKAQELQLHTRQTCSEIAALLVSTAHLTPISDYVGP